MTSKKEEVETINKGWGSEIIFANNELYCGKLLNFDKGSRFSMHFHMEKDETWYISKGTVLLKWINTEDASNKQEILKEGDVVRNRPGEPHQVEALTDAVIFEVSTTHFDEDSYRIQRGDSQSWK